MPFSSPFSTGPTAPGNTHDLGDLVRISAEFTDLATDDPMDPDVVKVSVRAPASSTTTYVYGTDPEVVKDSTGNYHMDIDANVSGVWYYRWWSTGEGQAAEEKSFTVEQHIAI